MIRNVLIALSSVLVLSANTLREPTASEVLQKASEVYSTTLIAEMKVEVHRAKWTKTMELKTWMKGDEKALAYILSPEKDKGTIFLKNGDEVWNYLPKINRSVKLPMATLSQQWMGTDLSGDDVVRMSNWSDQYEAELTGSKTIRGYDCYLVTLTPTNDADVLWGKLELFISKQGYFQMRTVFYDEDEEVVSELDADKIKQFGDRKFPSVFTYTPANKPGQYSRVIYSDLTFGRPIPDSFFTKMNLPQVKP